MTSILRMFGTSKRQLDLIRFLFCKMLQQATHNPILYYKLYFYFSSSCPLVGLEYHVNPME